MSLCISKHSWGTDVDSEVKKLLCKVFVGEGYTNSDNASIAFTSEKLRNRGTAFIAIETATGNIAGVIFYVPGGMAVSQIAVAQEAEFHLLAVDPLYRKSGLGEKLIGVCLEQARSEGLSRMVLSTQASMTSAHRLYFRMGFTRNEVRDWPRPAGGTYLVFEKSLAQ